MSSNVGLGVYGLLYRGLDDLVWNWQGLVSSRINQRFMRLELSVYRFMDLWLWGLGFEDLRT